MRNELDYVDVPAYGYLLPTGRSTLLSELAVGLIVECRHTAARLVGRYDIAPVTAPVRSAARSGTEGVRVPVRLPEEFVRDEHVE